jgi:hypothetical protein
MFFRDLFLSRERGPKTGISTFTTTGTRRRGKTSQLLRRTSISGIVVKSSSTGSALEQRLLFHRRSSPRKHVQKIVPTFVPPPGLDGVLGATTSFAETTDITRHSNSSQIVENTSG